MRTLTHLGALQIRAPIDGSISLLPNFRAGGPGRPAPEFRRGDRAWFGAPIAELPDLTAVQLTARVDEADRGRVQIGSGVRVRVDAVPDRDLTGTLKDISVVAKPDFTTWPPVRNFDVVVGLSDSDPRLRSGMSASARASRSAGRRPGCPDRRRVPTRIVDVVYIVNPRFDGRAGLSPCCGGVAIKSPSRPA